MFQRCETGLILGLIFLLLGCGGGGGGSPSSSSPTDAVTSPDTGGAADSCGVEAQQAFVTEITNDWYLWYGELASVQASDYSTAQDYLTALTAPLAPDGRDPGFSYVTTVAEDEANFSTGAFAGFGFRFQFDDSERFYFSDVFEASPAAEAMIQRGDELLAIDSGNGYEDIATLSATNTPVTDLFGPREAGVSRGFRIRSGAEIREVTVVKRELDTPPLVGSGAYLIERPGLSPVGYFNLRSFTSSAITPLTDAVATLSSAGVTDLIVDLRYNGGGLLEVAEHLLNLIGGALAPGQVSYRVVHNDKRSSENLSPTFAAPANGIAPLRIAFITTEATASASETVINSMDPFTEVVLVGADTLGKAVGQYGFTLTGCNTLVRLVAFEIRNGGNFGGYYTGLVDTGRFTLCPAVDDVTRPFTDTSEASIDAALNWLNSGSCAVANSAGVGVRRLPSEHDWAVRKAAHGPLGRTPWVQ